MASWDASVAEYGEAVSSSPWKNKSHVKLRSYALRLSRRQLLLT